MQALIHNFSGKRRKLLEGEELSEHTWKKTILKRDNLLCQICKNSLQDKTRRIPWRLEVHHIVARMHGGKNTLDNGITLCTFCHEFIGLLYEQENLDVFEIFALFSRDQLISKIYSRMKKRTKKFIKRTNFL